MNRFAGLLDLEALTAEIILAKLVSSRMIYAKIDRPLGMIYFAKIKPADEVLNSWSSKVDSLLSLMVKTNHLISKEEMLLNIVQK